MRGVQDVLGIGQQLKAMDALCNRRFRLRIDSERFGERSASSAAAARPRGNCDGRQVRMPSMRPVMPLSLPSRPTRPTRTMRKRKRRSTTTRPRRPKSRSRSSSPTRSGTCRIATNFSWTLLTGYLVLFMQAGFALLTCGLVRRKNAAHLMMLNFAAYVFAFLAYYVVRLRLPVRRRRGECRANESRRYADAEPVPLGSGQWGFLGGKGFFLSGPAYDAGSLCLTLFEVVFMETAGYIIVGAICERITFWAFVLCEIFMGAILYPMFGCWVWGGGWLSQLGATMGFGHGYVDFAGSTVVHAVGGFCAMALADHSRPTPRQVRAGRQASSLSRPQPRLCRDRHLHSPVRLDGF